MIYTPSRYPRKAFILITTIVLAGIIGGYYISDLLLAIALIFWIQYTVVLVYLQLKKNKKYKSTIFTEYLLRPEIRLILFISIGVISLWLLIRYRSFLIGVLALLLWWLFSLNFYRYYLKKKRRFYG